MIDEAGAASAAAEPFTPPQGSDDDVALPDPGGQQPERLIERSKETARASLDRAFATLEEQDADGETEGESRRRDADRDERGRSKAKEEDRTERPSGLEAPRRFSADAKAAWGTVPDSVKGETNRALRELNEGLSQYQEIFEPLKPFYQLAQKFDTTVHDTLGRYVTLDLALLSDRPEDRLSAIESVLGHAGITPRDYAAHVMGQKPDEVQSRNDETVRQLHQEITELRNQLGGVYQSVQQRREDEVLREVEAFADENARLNDPEFQDVVIRLLTAGMARDLKNAYDMAARLSPEPVRDVQVSAASNAAHRKPAAQTRNGNLSITGGPGSGSNPAKRKAPQTARESVDNAFASLGLG